MVPFGEGGAVGIGPDAAGDRDSAELGVVALAALPVGHAWRAGGVDETRAATLAARYPQLPPVLVRRHDLLVIDGAHTVAAARRLGMQVAHVQWFEGSRIEAVEAFVRRNSLPSSLPLSPDDRRMVIHAALNAEPTWSDRRIAQVCGVSPKMIARTRSGAATAQPVQAVPEKRVGRDGRARPVRAGAMRASILQMLDEQPNASLRTVASALGVSPETVRSVRRTHGLGKDDVGSAWEAARNPVDDLVLLRFRREAPAPWREDVAFSSTTTGEAFVDWFESTNIGDELRRTDEVPLSRIYEIADEARRRAAFWTEFADSVERRARRR